MTWNDKRGIARAITQVENGEAGFEDFLKEEYKNTGNAYVVGITGPPGAGKSSLTDMLAKHYVEKGMKVGIIAIDPTSPFSGGAILGDRIRMNDIMTDPNVFIRSMGTRGHLGGLSAATHLAKMVLDAAGADIIFIETVGVGQSEVEIVKNADTVLMVMVPGLGDDIQGMKAGIMEIGDVFAINKADLPGANKTKIDVENMLSYLEKRDWYPSVTMVSVVEKFGIKELADALEDHHKHLQEEGRLSDRRKRNTRTVILDIFYQKLYKDVINTQNFDHILDDVLDKKMDPFSAVDALMKERE